MSDKLFKQLRDYDRTKPTEGVEIGGILGLPVSSQTVEVPGRDGYVYVRIRNTNEIVQAQNEKVSPIFNLPILMKWDRGGYSISGRDTKRYSNWGSSSSFLPKHGGQHSFNGGDPTFIYSRQFVPFATMPSGTNGSDAVYIEPHVYRNPQDGSWNYVGDQFSPNLLAAKPTNSQAQMLLLYWDLNSDTVMVATGSAIVASATGTAQILAGLPLLMGQNDIPLAGIRLVSGTSAILWDNIYDVRQFATTTPPSFAGGFAVQDEGSPLGTGTTLNFVGGGVDASISGSVVRIFVTGSVGGSANPPITGSVVVWDEGVVKGSATTLNVVGANVDVSISGTVARLFVTGSASGGGTPAGESGQVQYNNAGSFGGTKLRYTEGAGVIQFAAGNQTVTGSAGDELYFMAANGAGTGSGGALRLFGGGMGGESVGDGNLARILIYGKNNAENAGNVHIFGANTTGSAGGDVYIEPGYGTGTASYGMTKIVDPLTKRWGALVVENISDNWEYTLPNENGSLLVGSGWTRVAETWTQTGNHAFTASSATLTDTQLLAIYRKGTKVRYNDGSVEFGVIATSASAGANSISVTLITNNDYAMAATTITDMAISVIENPEGFPAYFNYTPTLAGGGTAPNQMTIASSTVNFARWWTMKEKCHFTVDVDVSFGGTANARFDVSLPVTALFTNIPIVANCRDTGSGALPVGTGTIGTTTLIYFRKADISVWTLAATSRVYGCGEFVY